MTTTPQSLGQIAYDATHNGYSRDGWDVYPEILKQMHITRATAVASQIICALSHAIAESNQPWFEDDIKEWALQQGITLDWDAFNDRYEAETGVTT